MTEVCDFTVIVGEDPVTIGDPPLGKAPWVALFRTDNRKEDKDGSAFLILNVHALTFAREDAIVVINEQNVGSIRHYGGKTETAGYWFTQMIHFKSMILWDDDVNILTIFGADLPVEDQKEGNYYCEFQIKDLICFFKKEVKEAG